MMSGELIDLKEFGREIFVYLPESYNKNEEHNRNYPVVYVHDGDTFRKLLFGIMKEIEKEQDKEKKLYKEHIIVGISPKDRLREYTPWQAPSLVEKFEPFGGKGENYLDFIVDELKPFIDSNFNTSTEVEDTSMIGYSLGGLISLFSIYKYSCFGKIVSICGSQWFKGWIDFIEENIILNENVEIFIIAGLKEGNKKYTAQKDIAKYVEKSYKVFNSQIGISNVTLEWDNYGHNENVSNRYKQALLYLGKKEVL